MRYEKKMLILTGDGKGVVLIERSGLGVKFALRTFGVKANAGLKIGIVTPARVIIRELPTVDDPSAVFFVDDIDISAVHFALFDTHVVLYGTCSKTRMWEANIFDLLVKHSRPAPIEDSPRLPPLTPIAPPPRELPMPDGTGIPQTRARIYGDDTLAAEDFYTPLDLNSRMPEIDRFLDTPRVMTGKEQEQEKLDRQPDPPQSRQADVRPEKQPEPVNDVRAEQNPEPSASDMQAPQNTADTGEENMQDPIKDENAEPTVIAPSEPPVPAQSETTATVAAEPTATAAAEPTATAPVEQPEPSTPSEEHGEAEAAATAIEEERCAPWELTAKWLKSRSSRAAVGATYDVHPIEQKKEVKKIREATFFERNRADVNKLFSSAPRDEELAALLPDLEWIKTSFDGHTVSVGRVGDAYLCYAVRGSYEPASPLGDEAQWLPKLKTAPTGKGYWLIFQDLSTGEIVSAF